ncbi:hypothetical protein MLD52_15510 [Puniceicoccaceae bacterium K14]|nr:hypothetical protein [Puniceicoccaceae bacterium K14]
MKKIFLLTAIFSFLFTSQAEARKLPLSFGSSESLHTVQRLDTEESNGESYFLKYKTASYSFVFPLYTIDQGYVLTKSSDPIGTYYPLSEELIKENQDKGLFSDPMPHYSIGLFDYIWGYSFWIFALLIGLKIYFAYKKRVT